MFNNWYLEEKALQYRHQELLKEAELVRLAKQQVLGSHSSLYTRTLSKLGDNLVKTGQWLQDRYSYRLDFGSLELDDPCGE